MLTLLPVLLLMLFYVYDQFGGKLHAFSGGRRLLLAATIMLLFAWIILDIKKRSQKDIMQLGVQASFYVYVFMVLTLTGYFILFRELHFNWWDNIEDRVARRDHVNFQVGKIFTIYKWSNMQVLGNLVMLFPLGLYLPMLYPRCRRFLPVLAFALLTSIGIECLQLVTSYRSTDIDDVILNTAGACAGFAIYKMIGSLWQPSPSYRMAAAGRRE